MTDIEKARALNRVAAAKYKAKNKEALKAQRQTPEWREKRNEYLRRRYQRPEVKKREHERQNSTYATNPDFRKRRAVYGRVRRTGMTPQIVAYLLEKQGNACAICKRPFVFGGRGRGHEGFHADHCHDSGAARGLLCTLCNTAEGALRRAGLTALDFGKRLHEYLLSPPAKDFS